ncbi:MULTISPECIES: ASCH domain-containing protein [Aeromonas]|uniref:ASCH domain-containing protein n=1 Tax=Aeromonas TaxID=642 RepID=UPI000F535A16|nr:MULTISPECIES: ASCH domain-containing protein [Aeromonas]MDD9224751.1 ASCH domain-containing protein [Aeromonas hydrophila]MDX7697292.1 ASCH domain-containing protein [Aeromonas dhakensis]RQM80559.1 ASCH domain-containing protein [Aeromonas dhakensis]
MNQTVKNVLAGLGTFATAATIWMWGYSVGDGKSDSLVAYIKEDRDTLRDKLKNALSEADSLKTQLLQANNNTTVNLEAIEKLTTSSEEKNNENTNTFSNSQQLTIDAQSTRAFFNGELEITVIATNYTGNPLRHQVLANAIIPGKKPLEIRNADPGSTFSIGDYQVVITGSGTYSATFKVFKLNA